MEPKQPEGDRQEVPISGQTPNTNQEAPRGATAAHYLSRPRKQPTRRQLMLLGGALFLILSGSMGFLGGWLASKSNQNTSVQQQEIVLRSQGQLISQIASTVGPSVVSIEITSSAVTDNFFGVPRSTERQSAGTGIIISEDGLIITNRHVVAAGTTNVSVTLSDGTKYEDVEIVGRTSVRDVLDVAFLRIKDLNGKKLTAAKIGDSSKTVVGESVIAIGNALGQFQNTVTSGIISGFGRSLQASDASGSQSESLENLIQTDAAINQGNSGGPLVNLEGEVIGINTAVAGSGENIGFAIPINDVKGLITSVVEKGKLERPYLGVMYIPLTEEIAKRYDLNASEGAYVLPSSLTGQDGVIDGGPAEKAGVKEGDVITKVGNESITHNKSLTSLLSKHKVGEQVEVTVLREGRSQTIQVTLGAAPTD